jgi:hypothetical protein
VNCSSGVPEVLELCALACASGFGVWGLGRDGNSRLTCALFTWIRLPLCSLWEMAILLPRNVEQLQQVRARRG